MKLIASFPSGYIATRETTKAYTHAVYCPSFTHEGTTHCAEVTFAMSLQEAQRRADSMGYTRHFKHWNGGRRVYTRSKTQAVTPEIAEVTPQNDYSLPLDAFNKTYLSAFNRPTDVDVKAEDLPNE